MVNDGVTQEITFYTAQRVEQVINRKNDKQIAKGKQAGASGDGKQYGGFPSKFKAKNIKEASSMGNIKSKMAFKKKGQLSGSTSGGSNHATPRASKDSSGSGRFSSNGSRGDSFHKDHIPLYTTYFTYHEGKCRAAKRVCFNCG